jgi:hypothetical protein
VTDGWDVPVEILLACSSSKFRSVIYARYGRGEGPCAMGRAFIRDRQFFAVISFARGADMLLPLDCWAFENRPEAEP